MKHISDKSPSNQGRHILLMHAVLWAALILATAVILASSEGRDSFSYLLIIVLIPGWFASDQLMRRAIEVR